jgi:uncharacterized membrane protein
MTKKNKTENIFLRMHPLFRILISLLFSLLTYLAVRSSIHSFLMLTIILWNIFALTYLLSSWFIFFICTPAQLRQRASREDGSRFFVFIVVLLSSFAGMLAVLLLIILRNTMGASLIVYLPVVIAGMILSWLMVHTTFCFHYAHKYYNDDINDAGRHAEGLIFPNEKKPDYLDFAYFSLVLGMTFQVSDVQITSRIIRRIALFHGLLSFALSLFVVAMTINLIAGLVN